MSDAVDVIFYPIACEGSCTLKIRPVSDSLVFALVVLLIDEIHGWTYLRSGALASPTSAFISPQQ